MESGMLAKGVNGQAELFGDSIKISGKGAIGFPTQGFKGVKEIHVADVSSIPDKNPSLITRDYLLFAFLGGREAKRGVFHAPRHESRVMITKNSVLGQ